MIARFVSLPLLCVLSALLIWAQPGDARAIGWLPACDAPFVDQVIKGRFNTAKTRRLHDGASILSIVNRRERRIEAFGPSPVLRRYCQADAVMDHGDPNRPHRIYYRISESMGLAGIGWNVEFCVPGHDAWRVYGGNCRVLKQ